MVDPMALEMVGGSNTGYENQEIVWKRMKRLGWSKDC